MCLITKQNEPVITDADVVVYKLVTIKDPSINNKREVSPGFYYNSKLVYTENEVYETDLKNEYDSQEITPFDDDVINYLEQNIYPKYPDLRISDLAEKGIITAIGQGFHFALQKTRLRNNPLDLALESFTVPAGSEVYFDETGLGVSNKIIYTPEK